MLFKTDRRDIGDIWDNYTPSTHFQKTKMVKRLTEKCHVIDGGGPMFVKSSQVKLSHVPEN